MKKTDRRFLAVRVGFVLTALTALGSCGGSPLSLLQLVDGPSGSGLSVSPTAGVVTANSNVTLSATGGYPPYTYRIVSGSGSMAGNIYTAPVSPGQETIRITDTAGNTVDAVFQIDAGGLGLGLSPSSSTVYTGESVTFVPIGGSGSYAVAITTNNSGAGMTTYTYTAGATAGTDTITLTDTADLSTATANVTVNERALALNATAVSLATTAPWNTFNFNPVGGTGSFSFAITTGTPLGTIDTATGAYTATAAGTETIMVTDAYDGRTVNATITVTAGTFVTNVDYDADPITNVVSATEKTGGAFTADSVLRNNGSDPGSADLSWFVYASPDTSVGGTSDYLIDSGVVSGGLAAGAGTPVSISGQWPDTPGDYFLLLSVASPDSIPDAGNVSSTLTSTPITEPVSISPSSFTIYTGQTIQFSAGGEGGFTWDFDGGAATGASGGTITAAGLYTAGGTPATDLVRVTDIYDGATALATITVVATPLPNAVDYRIDSIVPSITTTQTGDVFGVDLQLSNVTTGTGGFDIEWDLYASTDTALGIGDRLLAGGTATPPGPSASVPVSSTANWPSEPGGYYLIARISAPDESNTTGNVLASGAPVVVTSPPEVDVQYSVTSLPSGGIVTPSTALGESFVISNTGSAAGTQDVTWSAFLSGDTVYDSGVDTAIGSGTIAGGLAAGANSGSLALTGTWPLETDPWPNYIIIRISANEDIDKSNNQVVTSAFQKTVTGSFDYAVTAVTNSYPVVLADSAIRETFTISNLGDTAGPTYDWNVYLSTDSVIGGDAVLAGATGITALGAAGSATTDPIPAYWPPVPVQTQYWLVVETLPTVADASPGNDVSIQGPFTVNPPPDYSVSATTVQTADGEVGGALNAVGTFDFTISNSGAAGSYPVSWSVYASEDTGLDGSDSLLANGLLSALGSGGSTGPIDIGASLWPAEGRYYYLIYVLDADDDQTNLNDTRIEGPFAVPYVYENLAVDNTNDDIGPTTTAMTAVTPLDGSLGPGIGLEPGELIRIDAVGDASVPAYDTYALTIGSGTTTIATFATWTTTVDGVDIVIWDENNFEGVSLDLADFREPEIGFFRVQGWSSGETAYVSASFLNGLTDPYSLYILGE